MRSDSPQAILHELESFRKMGSVLYIAAHPDDENTELLAYLSRGRNYRTAYLSLTRGDGGQNVLGADLGEKLGIARTQELLAARRIDGARQFFTRAIDFGFSKNYQETLNVWDKQEVLSDIVRVIRLFHPDVLITRFSPTPGGTHGHHTTSAILALEAFKLAGDPHAFPEQNLPPWQPKRIMWNASTFQKDKIKDPDALLKIDATGKDPVSGESFHDIASASRSMHKTQGFDTFRMPGGPGDKRVEQFQLLDGEPAVHDIMDGVDTSWNRITGGGEIGQDASDIITSFDVNNPAASVPALLKLRSRLNALALTDAGQNPVVRDKQAQLDTILKECIGLKTEAIISHTDVVPGEPMKLHIAVSAKSPSVDKQTLRWLAVRFPTLKKEIKREQDLQSGKVSSFDAVENLPATTPLTQPYYLRSEGTAGMFHVDDANLIGTAEDGPAFPIEEIFELAGQTLVLHDEPTQIAKDSNGNVIHRRVNVIPPVSLRFISDAVVMTPGSSRAVEVEISAARANSSGSLQLEAPEAWVVKPARHAFDLKRVGQKARFVFTIVAPAKATTAKILATAEVHGVKYHNQRQEITYAHLPPQLLQPPTVMRAVSLDLATRGRTVGYLPGAGDSIAENLQQMGYAVRTLDDANLTSKELEGLDAVVIGVRAFNVRNHIAGALPALFSYIEKGGTVISQYNRPDKLKADKIAPYDLHISPDRVTDEKAAITFLDPKNPVLNAPNKITNADFDGWVQERGLYFPNKWDDHFTPILACNDPGEPPVKGALLVAQYGKGYYIYTGLGFFRQLPAGVPGAYRLFANMVSIGK